MTLLPTELYLKIWEYLEVEDILNCCLVCKFWRDAANDNHLWKKLYKRRYKYNPLFNHLPRIDDFGFCSWRRRFAEENRLRRNWDEGKFEKDQIKMAKFHSKQVEEPSRFLMANDRFLFVKNQGYFDHWDIAGPITKKEPLLFAISKVDVDYFKVYNNTFILVQKNILQVFKTSSNDNFQETHRILINDKPCESQVPSGDITEWYKRRDVDNVFISCAFNGRYFLSSSFKAPKGITLNLWDIEKMDKLQFELQQGVHVEKVLVHTQNIFFIEVQLKNGNIIWHYSPEKGQLSQPNHFDCKSIYFDDDFILINQIRSKTLELWNPFENLVENQMSYEIFPSDMKFRMPVVVMLQNSGGKCLVEIINMRSSQVFNWSINFYIVSFELLFDDRLIISAHTWSWAPFFQIVNYKTSETLWKCEESLSFLSNSKTKLLTAQDNTIYIYKFWS